MLPTIYKSSSLSLWFLLPARRQTFHITVSHLVLNSIPTTPCQGTVAGLPQASGYIYIYISIYRNIDISINLCQDFKKCQYFNKVMSIFRKKYKSFNKCMSIFQTQIQYFDKLMLIFQTKLDISTNLYQCFEKLSICQPICVNI